MMANTQTEKPRTKRLRWDGLSPARRERFLNGLRELRSVTRASLMAGKRNSSCFYQLRVRDPAFRAAWDEALAGASAEIEAGLMARALAAVEADEERALVPLDFDEAMRLLYYFRARDRDVKMGPKRRYASPEETDAALLKNLDVLEARVRAREAKARQERRAKR